MKKVKLLVVFVITLITGSIYAQGQIFDVVSIGSGYTNQTFYSMPNGEISSVTNTDWDLAFQISGFEASILINGKNNVRLFKSGLDVNSWSAVTANDTIGMLNSSNELFNQDTSWWAGAFNITNDPSNQFDLGWGVYDFATHVVVGDSLYFLQMPNGDIKKVWIQALQNGIYNFAYADVDGSNEVNASLDKLDFPGKNFGYYSITNNTTIDREPNKYTWDLAFMQYMATTPFIYKVTGVLANDSVTTFKAYPVDVNTVTPWGVSFSNYINTIGYDWKSYDFNLNAWSIEDSTVFYVNGRDGGLWKLVFTGFSGAATGDFEFYKEQISATGVAENGGQQVVLGLYPNPSASYSNLLLYIDQPNASNKAAIYDVSGKLVEEINLSNESGLQQITLDISGFKPGMYCINVQVDGQVTTQKLMVNGN